MDGKKQRSYLEKVFDFVTGKKGILKEKREGKQRGGEESSHGFIDCLSKNIRVRLLAQIKGLPS